MNSYRHTRFRSSTRGQPRRNASGMRWSSLVAFLLVASFGILFAGCGGSNVVKGPDQAPVDDITFTEKDLERFQRLAGVQEGTGAALDNMSSISADVLDTGTASLVNTSTAQMPSLDLSMVPTYNAMRASGAAEGANLYRITNSFLNIRSEPKVSSSLVVRLNGGDEVTVLEFINAGWAKVQVAGSKTGYASLQYLARMTTEDRLAEEQKAFNGLYYVHFAFVNVRAKPDQKSEKLGQIDGDTFVRPLSMEGDWARVPFNGKEGYVSKSYLAPFRPAFMVRKDKFALAILRYRASDPGVLEDLAAHITPLKNAGVHFVSLRDVQDILLQQEAQKNVSLPSKAVVLAITELTPDAARKASDILYGQGVTATFFVSGKNVGLSGITQKMLMTFIANGFDIQTAGYSGDDLRALTNDQAKLDLAKGRQLIEDLTSRPVFAVDYPQGGVNDRIAGIAAEQGYLFGIGNAPEKSFYRSQLLRLPSFTITSAMSPDDVVAVVK